MKYRAFLSYSHAADGRLAPELQMALHRFAKPLWRVRAMRVFRDQTDLSANPGVWSSIEKALRDSESFVLLSSPLAAKSPWVQKEVSWWLQHRSVETMVLVLTDGVLAFDDKAGDFDWSKTNALPPQLIGRYAEEPRFVDMRWAKTADELHRKHPQLYSDTADVAVALTGVDKITLVGEDARQYRRTIQAAIAVVVVLLLLSLALTYSTKEALDQQARAVSRQLAAQSRALLSERKDLVFDAALLAAEGLKRDPSVEAGAALRSALRLIPVKACALEAGDGMRAIAFSSDGRALVAAGVDRALVWTDWASCGAPDRTRAIEFTTAAAARKFEYVDARLATLSDGGMRAAFARGGEIVVLDVMAQAIIARVEIPLEAGDLREVHGVVAAIALSDDGRWLAATSDDDQSPFLLYDLKNGVAQPGFPAGRNAQRGSRLTDVLAFDPASKILVASSPYSSGNALAFAWSVPAGESVHYFSDATTGSEIPATAFAFASPDELIAGRSHGGIQRWDLRSSPKPGEQLVAGPIMHFSESTRFSIRDEQRFPLRHDGAKRVRALASRSARGLISSAGDDGTVRLWSARELLFVGELPGAVATAISPDGRFWAGIAEKGTIRIWRAEAAQSLGETFEGARAEIDDRGAYFFAAGRTRAIAAPLDKRHAPLLLHYPSPVDVGLDKPARELVTDAEGSTTVAAVWPNLILIRAPHLDPSERATTLGQRRVRRLATSARGTVIAAAAGDQIVVFSAEQEDKHRTLRSSELALALGLDSAGRTLLAGGVHGLRAWDVKQGSVTGVPGNGGWVEHLQVDPSGSRALLESHLGELSVVALPEGTLISRGLGPSAKRDVALLEQRDLVVELDGEELARLPRNEDEGSHTKARTARTHDRLWEAEIGDGPRVYIFDKDRNHSTVRCPEPENFATALAAHPRDPLFAVFCTKTVMLVDPSRRASIWERAAPWYAIARVGFDASGERVILGSESWLGAWSTATGSVAASVKLRSSWSGSSDDGKIRVGIDRRSYVAMIDPALNEVHRRFSVGTSTIDASSASRDGERVLVSGPERAAIHSSETGNALSSWPLPQVAASQAISADGAYAAFALGDRACLARAGSSELGPCFPQAAPVWFVGFDRTDPLLIVSSGTAVHVYDVASAKELWRAEDLGVVMTAALDREHGVLVTMSKSRGIERWRFGREVEVREACDRAGRDLTPGEWGRYLPDEDFVPVCAAPR